MIKNELCQTLHWSSKSSARRVPRETRVTESSVALKVFSDRSGESDSSINLFIRFKDL